MQREIRFCPICWLECVTLFREWCCMLAYNIPWQISSYISLTDRRWRLALKGLNLQLTLSSGFRTSLVLFLDLKQFLLVLCKCHTFDSCVSISQQQRRSQCTFSPNLSICVFVFGKHSLFLLKHASLNTSTVKQYSSCQTLQYTLFWYFLWGNFCRPSLM